MSNNNNSNNIKDFRLPGINERGACNGVFILSNRCPVCLEPVVEACMAFGEPYWCLIHKDCAPFFAFDGTYPHQLAASILTLKR